jgi:hypothetical protein
VSHVNVQYLKLIFAQPAQAHPYCISQVIPEEQLEVLSAYPSMVDLLKYILVRPPIARPTPDLISAR